MNFAESREREVLQQLAADATSSNEENSGLEGYDKDVRERSK